MNIPLFKNYHDKRDIEYVSKVIRRGMYWANGPEIAEFEKRVSDFVGTKYCVSFNSGTSALHSVLSTCDVKAKEVIVPSFTFISTANSVLMAGGKPVFADIEDTTFGLDPEDVNEKIGSKTKAIMPIHYGGCPCRIKELMELAEDHGLLLIEDAAESFGAKIGGSMVGSLGIAAMFSFVQGKIMSTGEGGAVVTNSEDIYEKLKLFRSHGRPETRDYFTSTEYMDYISLGYNFRMPTMCAAQGLAQLENIDRIIGNRRKVAGYYDAEFKMLEQIRTPNEPDGSFHVYMMYSILVNSGSDGRDHLKDHLHKNGIAAKVYFEPVHRTYFYKHCLKYGQKGLPKTEEISDKVLSIPIYPTMTDKERKHVSQTMKNYLC